MFHFCILSVVVFELVGFDFIEFQLFKGPLLLLRKIITEKFMNVIIK